MSINGKFFVAGAVISPLVLTFGKLIVFLAGIVAIVWMAYAVHKALEEGKPNA